MTIPFTGAGSLFVRVGHQGGWLNSINTARGTTFKTNADNIYQDFTTYPDSALANGLLGQYNLAIASLTPTCQYLQGLAQNTLIQMVNDDVHLNSDQLGPNLAELIRQMVANSASVEASTVSVAVTPGAGNTGNGQVIASVKNIYGVNIQYLFDETINATVTNDSYSANPATAYQEPLTWLGENAITDQLSNFWPVGSGTNLNGTFLDPAIDASQTGNLLTNSDFQTFSPSNTPVNWPITIGSAGTTVFNGGSGEAFLGSGVLQFTGDGSQLTAVLQQFNNASGTTARLYANTVYALGFWVKVDSAPAAGVLRVSLVDGIGTSPTIIADDASTDNTVAVTLSGETSAWAFKSVFFRTPKVLPAIQALRIDLSTALTTSREVFVGGLVMAPATQIYQGGIYSAAIAGNVKAVTTDTYAIAVSNNYTSQWQQLAARFWNMRQFYPLQLPTSGSPTIADSLIT